jgi:hypothetical protein
MLILAAAYRSPITLSLVVLLNLIPTFLFVWGVVWLIRYLKRAAAEKLRIRMEVSKMAEEVHLLRQELKGKEKSDSPAQSE